MSLVEKVMIVDEKGKKRAINRKTAESERMQKLHQFQVIDEPIPAPVDREPEPEILSREEVLSLLESWNVKKLKAFGENVDGYKNTMNKAELIELIASQEDLYSALKND